MNEKNITLKTIYNVQDKKPNHKKRNVIIAVSVIAVILCVLAFLLMSVFGVFKAKNLGVSYTEKDLKSAINKLGINVYDSKTGEKIDLDGKSVSELLSKDNYALESATLENRKIQLTEQEATALVNEALPQSDAIKDVQIKVLNNGQLAMSGKILVNKAVSEYFPQYESKLPGAAPDKVNFYTEGDVRIEDGALSLGLTKFKTGVLELVSADEINKNASALESIYKNLPGISVNSLKVDKNGNIVIDALVPASITVDKS